MQTLYITTLAASMGFLGSLLGVSGGTFLVPIMVMGLHVDPLQAMPISLTCALATGLSSAVLSPMSRTTLQRSFLYEPVALLGTVFFTPLAHLIAVNHMLFIFSLFIFAVAILTNELTSAKHAQSSQSIYMLNAFGIFSAFVAGACTGLLGVGGGIVLVPFLRVFARIPLKEAMQISLFVMVSTSAMGLLIHSSLGAVPWRMSLLGAFCAVPCGMAGAFARRRMSDLLLHRLFLLFAIFVATATFLRSF